MDADQIRAKVGVYKQVVSSAGVPPAEYSPGGTGPSAEEMTGHLMWLLDEVVELLDAGREEAAVRRLDFVQGVLWAAGGFSLKAMEAYGVI